MKILKNQELLDTAPEVALHSLVRQDESDDEDDDGELVSTSQSYYLALVCPAKVRKLSQTEVTILKEPTPHLLSTHLSNIRGEIIALDLETRGTNPLAPEAAIAGLGLTSDKGTLYIHTLTWASDDERWSVLFDWLAQPGSEFVGHNVMFDGAWLYVWMGNQFLVNWKYDTYAIYRQLANEGYLIQKNGAYALKQAQIDLLGWDSRGDVELEAWLIEAGHTTANGKKADKSKMYLAPAEILGYYCGLDTYSTYHLLLSVFFPSAEGHTWAERFQEYTETFMINLAALIEGYISGIRIDREAMQAYLLEAQAEAAKKKLEFLNHPGITPHLEQQKESKLSAYRDKEPPKFKAGPKLGQQPSKFKKDGKTISKNWENWEAKRQLIESGAGLEISQNWRDWKAKLERMEQEESFNMNSADQLRWLFYTALGFPVKVITQSGRPATGKKAFPHLGEYGLVLKAYMDAHKEGQMVEAALAASALDGRIHPQFKSPGTFTGRLAGGGQEVEKGVPKFNIQQIPKKRGYLACWKPDPGFIFVDIDFTAVEPMVLTGLSKDPGLLTIYGPDAHPSQDIYLFVGAQLPGLGEKLRSLGYDPYRPTKEAVDATKKAFKRERGVSKTIQLGSQYGMGPNKLSETLTLDGIPTSSDEAYTLWTSYWNLFKGVKNYGFKLEKEWERRGGWILGAWGRPITCAQDLRKDLKNRMVQTSSHDCLMMFVEEVQKLRAEVDFEIRWAVVDFHDETIVQVPEDRAQDMCEVFQEAMRRLNKRIARLNPNFGLELKGVPAVEKDFVGFKISD